MGRPNSAPAGGGVARSSLARCDRRERRRPWTWLPIIGLSLIACLPPKEERLDCDDVLQASEANYSDLEALVTSDEGKGCGVADCHGSEEANQGLRFDNPNSAYDALTTRADDIYGQVASGEMPEGGTRWDESDLRLFRSWYCNGSFPAP
jgi:hypothetical protein